MQEEQRFDIHLGIKVNKDMNEAILKAHRRLKKQHGNPKLLKSDAVRILLLESSLIQDMPESK